MNRWRTSTLAPLLVLAVVLLVWDLTVRIGNLPVVILPGPLNVLAAAVRRSDQLLWATLRTAGAAITGLCVSTVTGVLIAFVFSQSAIARRALYPYAVLLQTVPIIAIAPIVIVSFGRGFLSVSIVASVISLFPIITNTTTGLLQIDRDLRDLFRLYRSSWWQQLIRLQLPAAMPYLITGIRIAGGTAIVGAIVGEFFVGSSTPGLGALIQRKMSDPDLSELYATVAASTLLGTIMFGSLSFAGDQFLKHRYGMSLSGPTT
ncbi:MAG: ABC transporter permease subunit [Planctomycetaceae bacterium]|nr:ABC transporter permease subunit [Planctomycetaceae bacterium]